MHKVAIVEPQLSGPFRFSLVASLLDTLDRPLLVTDRGGKVLIANLRAQQCLSSRGLPEPAALNLFHDLLNLEPRGILGQLESGEHEVYLPVQFPEGSARARIRWLPEPDWLVVHLEATPPVAGPESSAMRHTLEELLQEREITYRNLLAAYLRLQEVNR